MHRTRPNLFRKHAAGTNHVEPLEGRAYCAAHGVFVRGSGALFIFGDQAANDITVGRSVSGVILVNGGAVHVIGSTPTVANTRRIQIHGFEGDDRVRLDESNGALPRASVYGGLGNDVLTGGSGLDRLFGQAGDDVLSGGGAFDLLFGGDGADTLTGGAGDDQVFGDAGADRMVWNLGDGNDLNLGGAGDDTVEFNGGGAADSFSVLADGSRVRVVNDDEFALDVRTSESLVLNGRGGNDVFLANSGLAGLIRITLDGGAGDDGLIGGDGDDILIGGDGNDLLSGGRGNDSAALGAGDDIFVWNNGNGSDVVEGGAGRDRLVFNGTNDAERFEAAASAGRLHLARDVDQVTTDVDDIERIDLSVVGGADALTVNDLSGTDVDEINLNLAGAPGGASGDGLIDSVVVQGTGGSDLIPVLGTAGGILVNGDFATTVGLPYFMAIRGADAADALRVNGGGGNDTLDATGLDTPIALTFDGGIGDDTLNGSQRTDVLLGGLGDDVIDGNGGIDQLLMGEGDDTFRWDPGDGNETVEGQAGGDRMVLNGSDKSESFAVMADGGLVRYTVGGVTERIDLNGFDRIDVVAGGGADSVFVNQGAGTDLVTMSLNLGGGDAEGDAVIVTGTAAGDAFQIASFDGGARVGVGGTSFPSMSITGAEPADRLVVNTSDGNDVVDAGSLAAGAIALVLNGGAGNDELLGGGGNDFVSGGAGSDRIFLEGGDDLFAWDPGDGSDVVEGGGGGDTMIFNGSDNAENITVSANGGRVRFFRDAGGVTIDLDDVEVIDFNALGGADGVTVNDLTGTDVFRLNVNLNGTDGTPDGQADTVTVNGNDLENVAQVVSFGDGSHVSVTGTLVPFVDITGAAAVNDRLVINTLGGDDTVNAALLPAGRIGLTVNGGAGNDTLVGGGGDDTLVGGPGADTLDGGPGNNVIIQD